MARKLPVSVNKEEFESLIKATLKYHHKVAYLLSFGSGLRISEVCGLEKRDIDITAKRILVRLGKGSKDRVVPLPKGWRNKMINHIPLKCSIRALQIAFKGACSRSGLIKHKPTIKFHSLRHGFATTLINNGVPIHHIRTMLGHSNISTTNIYLEANPKLALKSYEDLF